MISSATARGDSLLRPRSAASLTTAPGLVAYGATKAAIHSVARSLRAELAAGVHLLGAGASARASSSPIPEPPPVVRIARLCSCMMSGSFLSSTAGFGEVRGLIPQISIFGKPRLSVIAEC